MRCGPSSGGCSALDPKVCRLPELIDRHAETERWRGVRAGQGLSEALCERDFADQTIPMQLPSYTQWL